jgi:hypothetical protein
MIALSHPRTRRARAACGSVPQVDNQAPGPPPEARSRGKYRAHDEQKPLRSQAWFGRQDKMGFYYRSFL